MAITILVQLTPKHQSNSLTYKELAESYSNAGLKDFDLFWYGKLMDKMRAIGLVVV